MPWKVRYFFYLILVFSIFGFIFPTHISVAIGYDIGKMIHWVYGFYIVIPSDPTIELSVFFNPEGLILVSTNVLLLLVFSTQLHRVKRGKPFKKNLIYVIALTQIIAWFFLQPYSILRISSWTFPLSAIFAIIGNRELKITYIKKNNVKQKNDIRIGISLLALSILGLIITLDLIVIYIIRYELESVSLLFQLDVIPTLTLELVMLSYGIFSLFRINKKIVLKI